MALFTNQSVRDELFYAYASSLTSLNYRINRAAPGAERVPLDGSLDTLIKALHPEPRCWNRLYEAEQRVVLLMHDDEIRADHTRRLVEAEHLFPRLAASLQQAFDTAGTEQERMSLHLKMVDELQIRYQKRSLDRNVRRQKANILNWIGIVIVLLTVGGLIAAYVSAQVSLIADYHLLLVLWFGAIGAFLSRIIAFQRALGTLDYDSVMRDYSGWSVALRLIVGVFGALVGYFLIRGQLVGGELFPNNSADGFFELMKTFRAGDANVAIGAAAGAAGGLAGGVPGDTADLVVQTVNLHEAVTPKGASATIVAFSTDFAKLLVWSVIAGFSERLIPDRLASVETAAQTAVRANA